MLAIIKAIFSFSGPLIDKIFGKNSERALELKAQKELEELRAFQAGRIPPRFMLFYVLVCVFAMFALLIMLALFFPSWLNLPDTSSLKEILDMGQAIIS